jgi:hypothetical protein
VSTETNKVEANVATAGLACSKCGSTLPEGAQFCLKCGKPVSVPAKNAADDSSPHVEIIPPALPPKRRKRHVVLWVLLALFVVGVAWVSTSESFVAQGIQELVGWKHDEAVLETPFSVGPHTFRYYKFSLPEGSMNVSIVGEFTATSDSHGAKTKDSDSDNNIEVFVLTEPAFAIWQNGYATSSVYESGRVAEGSIQSVLPPGAGIYYLVFSNKFAPKTAKNVHATVLLRYKSWLPRWFRGLKERVSNWIGEM